MFSVVQYYFDNIPREYPCGYCKQHDSYKRHGNNNTLYITFVNENYEKI